MLVYLFFFRVSNSWEYYRVRGREFGGVEFGRMEFVMENEDFILDF